MILIKILLTISILINAIVAFFVLIRNPKKINNLTYFNAVFWTIIWQLLIWILTFINFSSSATLWIDRFAFIAAIVTISSILFFVYSFIDQKISLKRIILVYSFPAFLIILFLTEYIIKNIVIIETSPPGVIYESCYGSLYFLFPLFAVGYLIWTIILFITKYKRLSGIRKNQFKYIIIGLSVPLSIGIASGAVIPDLIRYFSESSSYLVGIETRIGPICTVFMSIVIAYAISRHRLFGIKFIIRKGTYYLIGHTLLILVFISLIILGQQFIILRYEVNPYLISLISILLIAFCFEPLRKLNQQVVRRLIFTDKEKKKVEIKTKADQYAKKLQFTNQAT